MNNPVPAGGKQLLGQPIGLASLFLTEMWERFTFYGMRAILVLFLVAQVSTGGLGIDDKTATAIYGLYTAAVYLVALPGGYIADRWLGTRLAAVIGGVVMMFGHFAMAFEPLLNVALDRPLVGAGFRADNIGVFMTYAPTDAKFQVFEGNVWVAHSIYLQALGEHGFVGLLLFLAIWLWCWMTASRLARRASALEDLKTWVPQLMRMCQVSIIGFCVGGAFLSLMNVDLPYYILIFIVLCKCAVDAQMQQAVVSQPAVRGMATMAQMPAQTR